MFSIILTVFYCSIMFMIHKKSTNRKGIWDCLGIFMGGRCVSPMRVSTVVIYINFIVQTSWDYIFFLYWWRILNYFVLLILFQRRQCDAGFHEWKCSQRVNLCKFALEHIISWFIPKVKSKLISASSLNIYVSASVDLFGIFFLVSQYMYAEKSQVSS